MSYQHGAIIFLKCEASKSEKLSFLSILGLGRIAEKKKKKIVEGKGRQQPNEKREANIGLKVGRESKSLLVQICMKACEVKTMLR
jgi:hypothetical protein